MIDIIKDMHTKIIDMYDKNDKKLSWSNISMFVHQNQKTIVDFFKLLKKSDRLDVKIPYELSLEQILKQISMEKNEIILYSLIICSMHHIVYDLLSSEPNYYMTMDGREEMQVIQKPIVYYINMSIKNEQNIQFHAFILLYALESLFRSHFYIGIDYEYTNKKISLAQLNFEHHISNRSIIQIVSPNELEPEMMDNFIELIICNKYINKILHGSDSLDIPYMYEHMLKSDPKKIIRFTRSLIDTRFICEYYKLNHESSSDDKCSIYDAVSYFGVVSESKGKALNDLLETMPADYVWNIHKMPKSQVYYAFYDVIFLKYFYYRVLNLATKDFEDDIRKKAILTMYRHVLKEFTQFVYLEKREITFLVNKCKQEVDPVNNYMIRKPDSINKLVDIYNKVSVGLKSMDPIADIDQLLKVPYYKGQISILLKKMIYTVLTKKCKINKDKNTVWSEKLSNDYIYDFFNEMQFYHLVKIFKNIESEIQSRIREYC